MSIFRLGLLWFAMGIVVSVVYSSFPSIHVGEDCENVTNTCTNTCTLLFDQRFSNFDEGLGQYLNCSLDDCDLIFKVTSSQNMCTFYIVQLTCTIKQALFDQSFSNSDISCPI